MNQYLQPAHKADKKHIPFKENRFLTNLFIILSALLLFVVLFMIYLASRNVSREGKTEDRYEIVGTNPFSKVVEEKNLAKGMDFAERYLADYPYDSITGDGILRITEVFNEDVGTSAYSIVVSGVLTGYEENSLVLYLPSYGRSLNMLVSDVMLITTEAESGVDRSGNRNFRDATIENFINSMVVITADVDHLGSLSARVFDVPGQ
jgi:hypothetical protein